MKEPTVEQPLPQTKRKLLDAATRLMLRQGFSSTTVDQVCCEAGVTKGSFFHYFKTKEHIGEAAIDHFTCCQRETHSKADYNTLEDPLDRVLGMLDYFASLATDPKAPRACLVGNLAQEVSQTHPELRNCCRTSFDQWIRGIAGLLRQAADRHQPSADFDPESVATLILSLVQGSLLIAKTRQDAGVFEGNLRHCRAYVASLFGRDLS